MYCCTFIRGRGSVHRWEYTFGHGWERAELRASQTVHASPYDQADLRLAPLFFGDTDKNVMNVVYTLDVL
jgi:hypothetical protein